MYLSTFLFGFLLPGLALQFHYKLEVNTEWPGQGIHSAKAQNPPDPEALCDALWECDLEKTKALLEAGANPNVLCEEDDAITYCAECEDKAVRLTRLLATYGANLDGTDADKDSFLSYAIFFDNYDLVAYLLANGVQKYQRDETMGCLPLHSCQSLRMLKLLKEYGYDLNATCTNGRNLLHYAAKENLPEMAAYLVQNALTDPRQADENGETPYDFALRYHHPDVAAVLVD
ncbi:MAG: hypothetical protein GYB31_19040 [Bacteroidetes bacterium]|nr:hypothetical protein [Bacteroidota bacterium]